MAPPLVYKICPRTAWEVALARGAYEGSADDRRDGFIHLSTGAQVEATALKHFGGQRDLVLVALDAAALDDAALRYEPSRGGALFPHLYGPLPTGAALWAEPLPLDQGGAFVLPDRFRTDETR
ncbi:MAG: DUF952 domain-containing protein [Alphaproteobacteria bacterium]